METIKRGRRLIEQWEAVLTLLNTAALIIGALVATWVALIKGRAEAKKETAREGGHLGQKGSKKVG